MSSLTPFKLSTLALAIFSPLSAHASGIFLQEAVVANAGTTGAGDGVYIESAAASWTNPATMSFMGESLTTINTLAFDLEMDYQAKTGSGDANGQSYLPALSVFHAHQLNEDAHLGLALGVTGGSSLDYGSSWEGSSALDSITLNLLQLNPSFAFKVSDQWSWGVGAQLSWAALEQDTAMLDTDQDTDWAFGFNAGVIYRYSDVLDLGLSFRSKLEHDFDLEESNVAAIRTLSTDVAMPAIIDLSAKWFATEHMNLLASIQQHKWSEWETTYIDLNLTDRPGLPIDRDWDDVWRFSLGADYQLNSGWRLKTGFSYETSPQDDPTKQWVDVPAGEQWRYSIGASTKWDDMTIDFFYEYADLGRIDINRQLDGGIIGSVGLPPIEGAFDGRIHFLGMSLTL